MTDLKDLCMITDVLYQADLARLQEINAQEATILHQMRELEGEVRRAAALVNDEATALKQLGGDLLWKAWAGRKRQSLNQELARLRVQKEGALRALEKSFGKNSVSRDLRNQARQNRIREGVVRSLADEQAHMILRATSAKHTQR